MNLYESITSNLDNEMTVEEFEKKCEELGVTSVSPLYYVTGVPEDCKTIEQADAFYDNPDLPFSVNYKKDKYDLTEEAYEFINAHRGLAHKALCNFVSEVCAAGPLD